MKKILNRVFITTIVLSILGSCVNIYAGKNEEIILENVLEETEAYTESEKEDKSKTEEKNTDMPKLNKTEHIQYIQGYKDGTVRPRNHITREEVSAVFFRLLDPAYRDDIRSDKISQFSDMPDYKWSRKHVGTLTNGGIMKGYTNGMFKPEKTISRAELAAIVSRFDTLEEGDGGFIDIDDHWAKDQINSASIKGWIEGYPDGTFRPNIPITRAEFVTVVNHVLDRDVRIKNTLPGIKKYKDLEDYRWYYEAMIEALHSHDYEEERLEDGSEIWTEFTEPDIEM